MENLRKNKKYFNQKRITLIALVITIVALLILATVSINILLNDNGILNYAKSSGDKFKMEQLSYSLRTTTFRNSHIF